MLGGGNRQPSPGLGPTGAVHLWQGRQALPPGYTLPATGYTDRPDHASMACSAAALQAVGLNHFTRQL